MLCGANIDTRTGRTYRRRLTAYRRSRLQALDVSDAGDSTANTTSQSLIRAKIVFHHISPARNPESIQVSWPKDAISRTRSSTAGRSSRAYEIMTRMRTPSRTPA